MFNLTQYNILPILSETGEACWPHDSLSLTEDRTCQFSGGLLPNLISSRSIIQYIYSQLFSEAGKKAKLIRSLFQKGNVLTRTPNGHQWCGSLRDIMASDCWMQLRQMCLIPSKLSSQTAEFNQKHRGQVSWIHASQKKNTDGDEPAPSDLWVSISLDVKDIPRTDVSGTMGRFSEDPTSTHTTPSKV